MSDHSKRRPSSDDTHADLSEALPEPADDRSLASAILSSGTIDLSEPAPRSHAAVSAVSDATLNVEGLSAPAAPSGARNDATLASVSVELAGPAESLHVRGGELADATMNVEEGPAPPGPGRVRPAPAASSATIDLADSPPPAPARGDSGGTVALDGSMQGPVGTDQTAFVPGDASLVSDQTQYHSDTSQSGSQVNASAGTGEWTEHGELVRQPSHSSPTIDLSEGSPESPKSASQARPSKNPGSWAARGSQRGKTAPAAPRPDGVPAIAGYEVLKELGRGAMGVVYKARQVALNRIVALKMVLAGQHAGTRVLVRFQIEAEAVARLQHPNIVQIYEVGEEAGCPYFSLEFVDGGTLSDRIEGGKALPPREAAWVVQQLAQAMDCAHRNGVTHRDLKPANILLAVKEQAAGTTPKGAGLPPLLACIPKVSDFGLAKRQEDSGQTQAGSIMGTPSYMAPEQAEGRNDLVGPPADIYALGAILYDLLTGRPPFQGKTILETLHQVKKQEPVSPRKLCPKLPHDLDTICLKCLEKAPAKRYLSAQAMAEDLRRFLAGEPILARRTPPWERTWKYCKRRPAMAAIIVMGVVGLLGVIGGSVAWGITENRHAAKEAALNRMAQDRAVLAETRFKDAQEAVDFMLTRIGQERLEHEPKMEKVRRDLLEKALELNSRFLEVRSTDPLVRYQTGLAFKRVGDIRRLLGERQLSEQAYDSARGFFEGLAAENASNEAYRQDLAATWNNLGNLFTENGQQADAEKAYGEARALRQQLVEENLDNAESRQGLAASCYNLAVVKRTLGRTDEALPLLEQAQGLQEQLGKQAPNQALADVYQRELARTLGEQGLLFRRLGRAPEAEGALRRTLVLRKELAPGGNGIPEDRQALALAYYRLGVFLEPNNARLAEPEYREAVKLGRALTLYSPTIPGYRQDLALACNNLGATLLALGRRDEADKAIQEGLAIKEKLAGDFPNKPEYRRDLATSYSYHGLLLGTDNRLSESEAACSRAVAMLRDLAREWDIPENRHRWGEAMVNLATVLDLRAKAKEAEKVLREALVLGQELAEKQTQVPLYQFQWARTEFSLAALRQRIPEAPAKVRLEEAEKLYRSARVKLKALLDAHPGEADYAFLLGSCLNSLGDLLQATKRPDEALSTWAEGIKVMEGLLREDPDRPGYTQQLANLLHNVGMVQSGKMKLLPAEKVLRQSVGLREKLVREHKEEPTYRVQLAYGHAELAIALARRNQLQPSAESFQRAIAVLHEGGEELADRPDFLQAELIQQTNLGGLLKALGQDAEAKKCQERIKGIKQKLAPPAAKP